MDPQTLGLLMVIGAVFGLGILFGRYQPPTPPAERSLWPPESAQAEYREDQP